MTEFGNDSKVVLCLSAQSSLDQDFKALDGITTEHMPQEVFQSAVDWALCGS